jgi:microcystin-dependent protein
MPRNGSGTFSLAQPPFVSGTVISSAAMNSDLSDIASALTGSLPRDGQAGMTGQLKGADGSSLAPSYSFTTETNTGLAHPGTGQLAITIQGTQIGIFDANGWEGPVKAGIPIGTVVTFAGSTAPTFWYLCFGQAVSRTTFAGLFTVIGTTYGVGDGVTTFNLPDCRGRIIPGLDNMGGTPAGILTPTYYGASTTSLGTPGGSQSYTFLQANLPAVNFTNSGITLSDPGHTHTTGVLSGSNGIIQTGGGLFATSGSTGSSTTGISISNQGHASSGGSGTPQPLVQPSLVMNLMIYAGA